MPLLIAANLLQIENAFQHLRKLEEETRRAEAQRREQDRLEAAKRKEVQRITNVGTFVFQFYLTICVLKRCHGNNFFLGGSQERRQEEHQRRRTQEIRLTREELDRLPLSLNGAPGSSGPNSISGSGSDRIYGSIESSPR